MFYLCSSNPAGVPQPLPHARMVFLEWIGAALHGMESAKAERRRPPKKFRALPWRTQQQRNPRPCPRPRPSPARARRPRVSNAKPPFVHASDARTIAIRGAREHNLKNVDLVIPRDKFVVFTGLSGSGKSSLAFDTIYAEGQRRYVESLSAYARQFLEMMQKPDVDQIDGLSPAISIEQKTTSKNPRSTVGTVTEIHDYMRLLWARVGVPYSPATGLPIESQTVSQMVDRVLALPQGTRLYLLAPVVRGRKGEYKKEVAEYTRRGFQRLKIDGAYYEIVEAPPLDKKLKHDIDVVVDRIVVRPDMAARLADSFETALELSGGLAVTEFADAGAASEASAEVPVTAGSLRLASHYAPAHIVFSSKFACPVSGFTISEIEPRLFSFNNPFGACPKCGGIGHEQKVDADLVVPDPRLSLRKGAVAPWAKSSSPYYMQTLEALARHYKFRLETPFQQLPETAKRVILYGSGAEEIRFSYDDSFRAYDVKKPFEGVVPNLERRYLETDSDWSREEIGRYMTATPCGACRRLSPEARGVGGQNRAKAYRRDLGTFGARGADVVFRAARPTRRQAQRNRLSHLEGNSRPPDLSCRCRPRLSDAFTQLRLVVGRREPAHPPGVADRLGIDGRAIRAR